MRILVLLFIFLVTLNKALAGAPTSNEVFEQSFAFEEVTKALVQADLEAMQKMESSQLSPELARAENQNTLSLLRNLPLHKPAEELQPMSVQQGNKWIQDISSHSVVGRGSDGKYEQPGTSIGYCFGRAAYVHLRALKEGYKKEQIKKLWVVGPMSYGINWAFHVATAVRDGAGEWRVIDPVVGSAVTPEVWFAKFEAMSVDKKLRLYVTNPEKFTFALGKYSRLQLGLNLSSQQDWYRGYFKDLMRSFHKPPVKPADSPPPPL